MQSPEAPSGPPPGLLRPGWTSEDNASLTMHTLTPDQQTVLHFGSTFTGPGSVLVPIPTTEQIVDALLSEADKAIWSDWVSKRALTQSQADTATQTEGVSAMSTKRRFRLLFGRHAEGTHQTGEAWSSKEAGDNAVPPLTTHTITARGGTQADAMGQPIKALSAQGEIRVRAVVGSTSPRAWQTAERTFSDDNVGGKIPRLVTDLFVEQTSPTYINETRGTLPDFLTYLGSEEDRLSDPWIGLDGKQRAETNEDTKKRTLAGMSVVLRICQIFNELDQAKRDIHRGSDADITMPFDIAIPAHTIVPGDLVIHKLMPRGFSCDRGFPNASIYAVEFEVDTASLKDVFDPDWAVIITSTAIGALHLPLPAVPMPPPPPGWAEPVSKHL